MSVPFAIVGASPLWVRQNRMGLVDPAHTLAGRAIPCIAIRVKSTRHGTECRIDNLWLSLPMDAQNLIMINEWNHGIATTSVNLGLARSYHAASQINGARSLLLQVIHRYQIDGAGPSVPCPPGSQVP